MNVLSLFDGISCGQLALQRAGIKVDKYYASEIKEIAIKVTQANFPNTIQHYIEKDYEICKEFKVNKTASREKMWGNGINGNCPNVTNSSKINCITCRQDRWKNAGLIEFEDFCRFLTTRELEQGQTLPIGYTKGLTKTQAANVIGDGWTVDVIAHIFENLPNKGE